MHRRSNHSDPLLWKRGQLVTERNVPTTWANLTRSTVRPYSEHWKMCIRYYTRSMHIENVTTDYRSTESIDMEYKAQPLTFCPTVSFLYSSCQWGSWEAKNFNFMGVSTPNSHVLMLLIIYINIKQLWGRVNMEITLQPGRLCTRIE